MSYTKEDILEALKSVLYFPKHDSIVNLDMVRDIKLDGKKVSFAIFFPERDEQNENIVRQAAISAIINNVDTDAEVDAEIRFPSDPLGRIKILLQLHQARVA